ncbi:MAG: hypothetical protein R3Y05_01850 [bacterium]
MDFKKYENFIVNKARDLEVSLFNYHFLQEDKNDCILALTLYLNEDGGVSNINPDNLNNTSTLAACIYYLDILFTLDYFEYDDIVEEIISFLKKQKEFSYFHKTNKNKPCSELFKENKYYLELEAITYAYIFKYTKNKTYETKLNNLIKEYLTINTPSLNQIYYFKKVECLYNNELLKNKIITDTKLVLNDKQMHKLIFSNTDYLLNIYKDEFIKQKEYLLNNTNSLEIWERESGWKDYPEAESANIKYLSITLVNNLLFLKYLGGL